LKYFIKKDQCKGTCYHEFYKGKWDNETRWKDSSVYLHDDILYDAQDFVDAIREVITDYDPYGPTEVSVDDWLKIGKIADQKDILAREIYQDANMWVQLACVECGCITILGI